MSNNDNPANLEILRMAREIVHNEYIDAKAQLHNKWLVDADLLWRSSRMRLVYPPFPPYPTEDVIVARAKVLLNFLSKEETLAEPPVEEQPISIEDTSVEVEKFAELPAVDQPVEAPTQVEERQSESLVEIKPDQSYTERNKELHGAELEEAVNKNLEEYTKTVVARRDDYEATTSTRLLPSLLKRIDEIKRNWA